MKKIFTILLGIALILPLYSQGKEKEGDDYTRRYFEIGFDAGVWFDNGIAPFNDIFRKRIVFEMSKVAQGIQENGAGVNFGLSADSFVNIKDITIWEGLWDFGFIIGIEGGVNMNIPKSLFTLIAEGNNKQHDTSGKINASGGIFTEIGLRGSVKYEVEGRTLYAGIKPAIYTPAVYIPANSGITYHLYTEKNGKEGLFLDTKGDINIYTPTSLKNVDPGRFIIGPSGFDLSLEGEYALFPFLDIGGSLTNIPLVPATLTNRMKLRLVDKKNPNKDYEFELSGEGMESADLDLAKEYSNNVKKEVYRLLRFDVYACYKPYNSEFVNISIRPNIGFSVNVNKEDEKGYFNTGLEARLNLMNMFTFYLNSGYKEAIWRHKAGLGFNIRPFEIVYEAAIRDETFVGCFMGRCFDMNLGLCFGW